MYLVHDRRGQTLHSCAELGEAVYMAKRALPYDGLVYVESDDGTQVVLYGPGVARARAPAAIETTANPLDIAPENVSLDDKCDRCQGAKQTVDRATGRARMCQTCGGTGRKLPPTIEG